MGQPDYYKHINDNNSKTQNCSTCEHQSKCYSIKTTKNKSVSHNNVAINILICRIKSGIDTDSNVKMLLELLKPGIISLANIIRQKLKHDATNFNEIIFDIESKIISLLKSDYAIGDFLVATAYLFDRKKGYAIRFAQTYMKKRRKFSQQHKLYESVKDMEEKIDTMEKVQIENYMQAESTFMHELLEIIEDGYTLNFNEYRVLKFCMVHANEMNASRHIDGLHLQLATLMGVSRPRITKLYKTARGKLLLAKERISHEE